MSGQIQRVDAAISPENGGQMVPGAARVRKPVEQDDRPSIGSICSFIVSFGKPFFPVDYPPAKRTAMITTRGVRHSGLFIVHRIVTICPRRNNNFSGSSPTNSLECKRIYAARSSLRICIRIRSAVFSAAFGSDVPAKLFRKNRRQLFGFSILDHDRQFIRHSRIVPM
jgi:hypothetical protein